MKERCLSCFLYLSLVLSALPRCLPAYVSTHPPIHPTTLPQTLLPAVRVTLTTKGSFGEILLLPPALEGERLGPELPMNMCPDEVISEPAALLPEGYGGGGDVQRTGGNWNCLSLALVVSPSSAELIICSL